MALLVASSLAAPHPASPAELASALLGVDPSFAPQFGRRPYGTILQRTRHLDVETIRSAGGRLSITKVADLAGGRRLVRLDGFGRAVDHELGAALRSVGQVILDLRHNRGGILRRMLRVAGRFTGPVPGALKLVADEQATVLAVPRPSGPVWHGRITVLVGPLTISSGEVLAALLRRHAGARVLGERTFGKDYVLRVERIDRDWQALIPDGRIEVPGEVLAGGLQPDGPISDQLAASLPTN
jgi:Peptidase family S41